MTFLGSMSSIVHGVRVKDLTNSYILLTQSTSGAGIPLRQAQQAFEGIVAASRVMGKSSEDTTASLTALAQIASKGVVSMEEMRQQLGERLPGAMQLLADGLHMTTGELIKMISKGQLAASALFEVFGPDLVAKYGIMAEGIHSIGQVRATALMSVHRQVGQCRGHWIPEPVQGLHDQLLDVMNQSRIFVQGICPVHARVRRVARRYVHHERELSFAKAMGVLSGQTSRTCSGHVLSVVTGVTALFCFSRLLPDSSSCSLPDFSQPRR